MGGFDLQRFLEDCREEGEVIDAGTFTMVESKALDKLAKFALPGEYDWALKVVQAVNCWGCPVLRISQTRVASTFFFCPSADLFPSETSVIQTLRQHSASASIAEQELALALRALVDQAGLSFVLSIRRNGQTADPIYSGVDVSSLSARERNEWAELKEDGVRLTVSHLKKGESFVGRYLPTFSLVADRQTEIFSVLAERAFTSRTVIKIDGLAITNPFLQPMLAKRHQRPVALGWRAPSEAKQDRSVLPLLKDQRRFRRPAALDGARLDWYILQSADWKAVLVDEALETESHMLCFLRHGVVCHNDTLPNDTCATTLFLALDCEEGRTDISGLALAKDGLMKEKRQSGIEWIRSELETLPTSLKSWEDMAEAEAADEAGTEGREGKGLSILSAEILPGLESSGQFDKPFYQLLKEAGENVLTTLAWPLRRRYLGSFYTLFENDCRELSEHLEASIRT